MLSRTKDMQGQEQNAVTPGWKDLACPTCGRRLHIISNLPNSLVCFACSEKFLSFKEIPRLLSETISGLSGSSNDVPTGTNRCKTAESLGFQWTHFSEM
jgi:uncharacterized protein YbaR (Trm112 family)